MSVFENNEISLTKNGAVDAFSNGNGEICMEMSYPVFVVVVLTNFFYLSC